MTLEDAAKLVNQCAGRMNSLYQTSVFDEWAIVVLSGQKNRVLAYVGPRQDRFEGNLFIDATALRVEVSNVPHNVGDFEFARHGTGTHFDAFMVLGEGIYLICNNTMSSMNAITKDPLWLSAQVPFAELGDKFRSAPLVQPI